MDREFWARPPMSPALNFDLTNILSHAYDDDPPYAIRALLTPAQRIGLSYVSYPLTTVRPPFTAWTNSWGMSIFVGGTSGQIHFPELFDGWLQPNKGPDVQSGASAGFAHAAREILTLVGAPEIASAPNLYLVGHSYGGACVQALASILAGAYITPIGIWTYGAPRPGTTVLQNRIGSMRHYRWFNDDDPVRWIPPHSDESILLDLISSAAFIVGMNRQVQTATSFQLDRNGIMTPSEGEPTALHAVGLSITNWCTDNHGFRSVNHAAAEYRRRFQLALPLKPEGPAIPRSQPQEEVGTLRPREIQEEIREAVPVIEQQLALPTSEINAEIQQWPVQDARLRYKRRKYGRIWVVKFGDEIVDVGPGKRKAGQIARSRNRAARAMARTP